MPRMTVSIASLIVLSSSVLVAADESPFSRWEEASQARQRKTSQAATNQKPKTVGGTVEFFSPHGTPATNTAATAVTSAAITSGQAVKRERLQPDTDAAIVTIPSSGVSTAGFTVGTPTSSIQQTSGDFFEAFTEEPASQQPASKQSPSQNSPRQNSPNQEPVSQKPVSQSTASQQRDVNPFEEFLGQPQATQTAAAPAQQQKPPVVPEKADFGNSDFSASVSVESAADLTEPDGPVMPTGLSGSQTPSVTLQWMHHGEFNLGQECRCDLVLENTGRSTVRNVVAEAVLPNGLQVIKATPAPATVGGTATWTFGELQAGQKRTVELVVVPSSQGETQVSAFVRFTGGSTSSFAVHQPLLAVKVEGPETVEVGQQVNYTVAVSNPGTGKAKNVVIQAAIPEGLEHRQGGSLTIDIGTLNPGELRRARLSLTGVKGGQHRLAVRTVGDGGMQDQTVQNVTVAEPKLNIGLRGPANRRVGQVTDFELIVINEGRVDSSNVRAKYKVPTGFEFVKADVGGMYNPQDRTIDWFVGTLEPDQKRQFTVSLRAKTAGQVIHQAGVISEHGKMTMAEHKIAVQGNAELKLVLVSSKRQVTTGELVSYEVQVDNVGQSTAENVGLSLEIPPGLELQDIAAPTEYIADNGVVIFRSLPAVEPGTRATFTLQTRCKRSGSHHVRARLASESVEEALIGEETTIGRD